MNYKVGDEVLLWHESKSVWFDGKKAIVKELHKNMNGAVIVTVECSGKFFGRTTFCLWAEHVCFPIA